MAKTKIFDGVNKQHAINAVEETKLKLFFPDARKLNKFVNCLLEATYDSENTEQPYDVECPESLIKGCLPCVKDTDGDGIPDGMETEVYGSDPEMVDTDADGLTDAQEVAAETDPTNPDTDGDGTPDGTDAEPTNNAVQ